MNATEEMKEPMQNTAFAGAKDSAKCVQLKMLWARQKETFAALAASLPGV